MKGKPFITKPLEGVILTLFLSSWAALVWILARTINDIRPAMSVGDPAGLAVGLILLPWLFYLAQSLFYLPRRATGRPIFIGECLFNAPLAFLPFPSGAKIETGPALETLTTADERATLLSEAETRLRSFNAAARLTRLLEARSPLDIILTRLSRRSPFIAWPAALIYMIMGPARQLMRLWGFFFFLAWRAWDDPGPEQETTACKRAVALDLEARLAEKELIHSSPEEKVKERFGLNPAKPTGHHCRPGGASPRRGPVRLKRLLAALRRVYNNSNYGGPADAPDDDISEALYRKPCLDSKYRGLYLDVPVTMSAETPADMYDGGPEDDPAIFYVPELGTEVERAALLKASRNHLKSVLTQWPADGLVRLDGRLLPAWRLRAELLDLEAELDALHKRLAAHHRRCRSSHLAAATKRGSGWPEALRGAAGLLHLAEHERQTLDRTVDEFVNPPGPQELRQKSSGLNSGEDDPENDESLRPATALPFLIHDMYARLASLEIPAELEARENMVPVEELPPPEELDPDSWSGRWEPLTVNLFNTLDALKDRALTALLVMENRLESEGPLGDPPMTAFEAPGDYLTVTPPPPAREHSRSDAERLKSGFGRSAAALLVMALLIWQGQTVGHSRITVYNGLGRDVTVTADGRSLRLAPFGHGSLSLRPNRTYEITAAADGRLVESFQQRLAPVPASEVYNIAGAAPLMEWRSPRPPGEEGHFLGRPRWLLTRAEFLFRNPPSAEKAGKLVLSGYGDAAPAEILRSFESQAVRDELIRLHAIWDNPGTPWFLDWQALLFGRPYAAQVLLERLREPDYLEQCAESPAL